MISKSKLGAFVLIAMIGAASPAFAQGAYSGDIGAGNYGYSYRAHAVRNGEDAYARVPGGGYGSENSSAATGGGSAGYNWAVEHDD